MSNRPNDFLDSKSRVVGNPDWPDRKMLPNAKFLGDVPKEFAERILSIVHSVDPKYNDILDNSAYAMANTCTLTVGENGEKYQGLFDSREIRHILLQEPESPDMALTEKGYTKYVYPDVCEQISQTWAENFYRARIAILAPGAKLDWHIDTNTNVSCRFVLTIQGEYELNVQRRKEVEEFHLVPGQAWFLNTGWPHMVENTGDQNRIVVLVSCDYPNLKRFFDVV